MVGTDSLRELSARRRELSEGQGNRRKYTVNKHVSAASRIFSSVFSFLMSFMVGGGTGWWCVWYAVLRWSEHHTRSTSKTVQCLIYFFFVFIFMHVPSFSWPAWSSAAVAHCLQGLTCCAFRDAILHSLVVLSDYLSYCGLPMICLLILLGHQYFCSHLGIVLFWDHSIETLETIVCANPSFSELFRPVHLASTISLSSMSFKSLFYPILMLSF